MGVTFVFHYKYWTFWSWHLEISQVSRLFYCFLLPLDRNMMFVLNVNNIGHEKINMWFKVPLTIFFYNMFLLILKREREREREKHWLVAPCIQPGITPNQGLHLQLGYVPWLRIELMTFQCTGRCSANWGTLASASYKSLKWK